MKKKPEIVKITIQTIKSGIQDIIGWGLGGSQLDFPRFMWVPVGLPQVGVFMVCNAKPRSSPAGKTNWALFRPTCFMHEFELYY